jgi:transmembrane sensor
MKTIVGFPDQRILAEEAAEWLIRLDADTPPTRDELKALGEWLHRSPAHREELESLADLWGRMNVLTELAVPLEKHTRPATRSHHESVAASRRSSWRWTGRRVASVAASLILAAAIGVVLLARGPATDPLLESNGLYATAVGQQKTTTLADGSEVVLNTNSQISVDYGDGYRQVHLLQGEALFTVAKNAARPFRVYAGNGRIEALGTAFSVYLNGEYVNVTVTEGRVSLASLNPSRPKVAQPATSVPQRREAAGSGPDFDDSLVESLGTLNAGQIATIRSSVAEAAAGSVGALEITTPIPPEELAERLAWREGILMFSGDRLEDVINEVGRYTTVSIEIPDAVVRNMRIGGRFPVGETDVMFSALETNFNLRVTHSSHNRVVISAASE